MKSWWFQARLNRSFLSLGFLSKMILKDIDVKNVYISCVLPFDQGESEQNSRLHFLETKLLFIYHLSILFVYTCKVEWLLRVIRNKADLSNFLTQFKQSLIHEAFSKRLIVCKESSSYKFISDIKYWKSTNIASSNMEWQWSSCLSLQNAGISSHPALSYSLTGQNKAFGKFLSENLQITSVMHLHQNSTLWSSV